MMYDYEETMLDIILDLLERNDLDLLRGIQTFDSALDYPGVMGMEAIMTVLFNESINAPAEAKQIREDLATKGTEIYTMGMYETLEKRAERLEKGLVPFSRVTSALKGLRSAVEDLYMLQKLGLIEVERMESEMEPTHIRLSDIWNGAIEDIIRQGREATIFGSAMGRILSVAIHKKGFTSLIPLIHAYLLADRQGGELGTQQFLERCCPRVRRPYRFFTNLLERDKKKVDDIKAFTFNDGTRMIMNPAGVRTVKEWRTRANARGLARTA